MHDVENPRASMSKKGATHLCMYLHPTLSLTRYTPSPSEVGTGAKVNGFVFAVAEGGGRRIAEGTVEVLSSRGIVVQPMVE